MASDRLCRWWSLALSVAMLVTASIAAADPTPDERARARALMDEGDIAFEAKAYDKALQAYQAAHTIMAVPSTGLWLAKAQAALGMLREAREAALEVTRMPKRRGEHPVMERSRVEASELARTLALRIPTLRVFVNGAEDGTAMEARVDGAKLDEPTAPQPLNPGTHAVRAEADGFSPATATVKLAEGDSATVTLQLVRPGAPATLPLVTTQERPTPETPTGGDAPAFAWIGFGVGGACLVAGAITGLAALSHASSAKEQCKGTACDPSARSDIDAANVLGWVSTAAFGVGAAGVAVGVVALATRKSTRKAGAEARVTALVHPTRLELVGTF